VQYLSQRERARQNQAKLRITLDNQTCKRAYREASPLIRRRYAEVLHITSTRPPPQQNKNNNQRQFVYIENKLTSLMLLILIQQNKIKLISLAVGCLSQEN
jgi:hypothetical protein